MKCELCHKNKAETALTVTKDGKEEELYVCKKCAAKEKSNHVEKVEIENNSESSRSIRLTMSNLSPEGGQDPVMDEVSTRLMAAVDALFAHISDSIKKGVPLEQALAKVPRELSPRGAFNSTAHQEGKHFHLGEKYPGELIVKDSLQLEGLFQTLELEDFIAECHERGVNLVPYEIDNFDAAGHVYEVRYEDRAQDVDYIVTEICDREARARARLLKESPRIFMDTVCRALAILKNCRLLARGELFDLLSPLRVAAIKGLIDNISPRKITELMERIDLLDDDTLRLLPEELNREDGERADDINEYFASVKLSIVGKEYLQ